MSASTDLSLSKRVVFLIGAGHSIPANGPKTLQLTSWIVDGGPNIPIDRSSWTDGERHALTTARDHLSTSGVEPTYESIFTWLWTNYFATDPRMYRTAWNREDQFDRLDIDPTSAYDALRRIEDGVSQALADNKLCRDKAPTLTVEAIEDVEVSRVTIITLNHDRLLEKILSRSEVEFADGFAATRRRPPAGVLQSPTAEIGRPVSSSSSFMAQSTVEPRAMGRRRHSLSKLSATARHCQTPDDPHRHRTEALPGEQPRICAPDSRCWPSLPRQPRWSQSATASPTYG